MTERPFETCKYAEAIAHFEILERSQTQALGAVDSFGPVCLSPLPIGDRGPFYRARAFIWDHWINRRPGYAIVTTHSREGGPTTSMVFIQQDEMGEWYVEVLLERLEFPATIPAPGEALPRPRRTSHRYTAAKIIRVNLPKGHSMPRSEGRESVHPDAALDPSSYRLWFLNQNGERIAPF